MSRKDILQSASKRSVKFGGGSVMVFGMISTAGPGPLVRLHGRINAAVYKRNAKAACFAYFKVCC